MAKPALMPKEEALELSQAVGKSFGGNLETAVWAVKHRVAESLGMDVEEWFNTFLGGYVKLEAERRREVVRELSDEGMSPKQIGDVIGVSDDTVRRDVAANAAKTNGDKPDVAANVAKREAETQETENLEAWKAKHEAELEEQHAKECFYRVTEEAYSKIVALSVKEFTQEIYDRIEDIIRIRKLLHSPEADAVFYLLRLRSSFDLIKVRPKRDATEPNRQAGS
jgi:hypothetical protein